MVFLTLLGLPLDDLDFLIWFKNGIIRATDDEHRSSANTKMIEYLYAELDRREASGEPGDDLIGGFITAEVDGDTLTREDVIDITFLLVLAGLDTVAASLSCIVDWFARHPDQRQRVLDDPETAAGRDRGAHALPDARRRPAVGTPPPTSTSAASRCMPATARVCGPPPTSTTRASTIRSRSTSTAPPSGTSPSQRVPPVPRLAPRPHGAHRDPQRAPRAHPRLRPRPRPRARATTTL